MSPAGLAAGLATPPATPGGLWRTDARAIKAEENLDGVGRLGLARHLAPSPAVIIFASRVHRPAHNPATTLAVTITASPGPRIA
jgi:hypothetical protein